VYLNSLIIFFDLNEFLRKKCLIFNNFSTVSQNITKPTLLVIKGFPRNNKSAARDAMI
jgi:hypothetical protein